MLRLAFWLTGLLLFPLGMGLYNLPQDTADMFAVSPLWLARGSGALVMAWALALLAGGVRAERSAVVLLVAGNLLLAATLGAAAYRLDLPGGLERLLWTLTLLLLVLGLGGLLDALRSGLGAGTEVGAEAGHTGGRA